MLVQGCTINSHSQHCVELKYLSGRRIAQYARRGFEEEYLSFCFTFAFTCFPLIQLKVTKIYEIADCGSPESSVMLAVNVFTRVTATLVSVGVFMRRYNSIVLSAYQTNFSVQNMAHMSTK